jgi:hypothetical protein
MTEHVECDLLANRILQELPETEMHQPGRDRPDRLQQD